MAPLGQAYPIFEKSQHIPLHQRTSALKSVEPGRVLVRSPDRLTNQCM